MCLMNQKPVIHAPCNRCPEFLNSCMPLILDGYLHGECDQCYCEFCGCYEECVTGMTLACHSEQE